MIIFSTRLANVNSSREEKIKEIAAQIAATELDWYTRNPLPEDPGRQASQVVKARLAEERRIRSVLGYASTILHGGSSLKITPNSAALRLGGRS